MKKKVIECVETGQIFPSIVVASKDINLTDGAIGHAVRTGATAGGFHWRCVDDPNPPELKPDRRRPVICLETGYVYPSVSEASRKNGLKQTLSITNAAKRGSKAAGYHWCYVDEPQAVKDKHNHENSDQEEINITLNAFISSLQSESSPGPTSQNIAPER